MGEYGRIEGEGRTREIVDRELRGDEEAKGLVEPALHDEPHGTDSGPSAVPGMGEKGAAFLRRHAPSGVGAEIFDSFEAVTRDFMTGGNRTHNQRAHYLTQEILRILQREGLKPKPAEVRRLVHDELARHKINDGREHNTNVLEGDLREIVEHVVSDLGRRSGVRSRIIETSEDMHLRIEDLIETALSRPPHEIAGNERDIEAEENLRALLRTSLRAEFAGILMNEAYVERLEDVVEFYRESIVFQFEERAVAIVANAVGPWLPRSDF